MPVALGRGDVFLLCSAGAGVVAVPLSSVVFLFHTASNLRSNTSATLHSEVTYTYHIVSRVGEFEDVDGIAGVG